MKQDTYLEPSATRALTQTLSDGPVVSEDQRGFKDRRHYSLTTLWQSLSLRRRVHMRRNSAPTTGNIVDQYEERLLAPVLGILLLCNIDAHLTLLLLSNGGVEVNPIMAALLEANLVLFFMVKFAITSFCVLLLLPHRQIRIFNYISGHQILILVLVGYLSLILYELILLGSVDIHITLF